MRRRAVWTAVVVALLGAAAPGSGQAAPGADAVGGEGTRVVLLGTGTPNADPERWGPAVAVVVDGASYLVDAGPGVVRRAAAAAERHGMPALEPANLRRLFVTHLHSDHTLGLPDLMLSPWVLGRPVPLRVWGPPGTRKMARAVEEGWGEDVDMRVYGLEPQDTPEAYRAEVTEVSRGGTVYEDERVRVRAIPVDHGSWPYAYGYRFETADRVVVISGDARPTPAVAEACGGCDVLVHEVYSAETYRGRPPAWRTYHAAFHTSTDELADLADRADPGVLVLYHQLFWGTDGQGLEEEVRRAGYEGRVVSGEDLDVY